MPVNPELRRLDIDLPAQPQALVQLSLLMADDDLDLRAASALIETDMALAAAVLRAVNSSFYGLKGRVQSAMQAVQYLGLREIAAITYEMALRAAFPPGPALDAVWARAGRRGLIMGRLGQRLGVDGWAAHSAGLFEECGKAVLMKHAPEHYASMLRAAPDDAALAELERAGFGVSHDALGAALTDTWGLGAAASTCVRLHLAVQTGGPLPTDLPSAQVLALSAVAHAALHDADVAAAIDRVAAPAGLDAGLLSRAWDEVRLQIEHASTRP